MKFSSCRGGEGDLSFEDVLFRGYALDGGMILPESIPTVPMETLKQWARLSYPDVMKEILALYITEEDLSRKELNDVVDEAMTKLTHKDKVPIERLKNGLNILECYHGPSLAFKDLSMAVAGQLLKTFSARRRRHANIFVATSGDTGSSAIEAVKGLEWIDLIVALPRGRISQTQELQMTTVIEDNIHVCRVDGTSDDLDVGTKSVFTDEEFTRGNNFSCLNSVNIGRLLPQMAHFFYGYFQMCPAVDQTVEIVLPSGGLGNCAAGCVARSMGLPISMVIANNRNNAGARTVSTGVYACGDDVTQTLSPAMDIQLAYNMERVLCMLSGMDRDLLRDMMATYERDRSVTLPEHVYAEMKKFMTSFTASDDVILTTMRRCYEENRYVPCPHTAVAIAYHYAHQDRTNHPLQLVVATASPAKFEAAVLKAGLPAQPHPLLADLETKPTKYEDWEANDDWAEMLKSKVRSLTQAAKKKQATS